MALSSLTAQINEAVTLLSIRWQQLNYYLSHTIHPSMPLLLYGCLAALLGCIVKRYMQSLLNGLILAILFICCAQYCGLITLNMLKINQLFGFSSHYSLQSYSVVIITWIRNNALISAWSAGGFFIGYSFS